MNPQALCSQAVALHQRGRIAEAERLYVQVLAATPADATASHLLGVIRFQQGRYDEARKLIDVALKAGLGAVGPLMVHGLLLQRERRLGESLACFDRILAMTPDSAEALNNRGNVLADMERFAEALSSFDRALAGRPDFAMALFNRGGALRGLGRHAEALASFDRALAIQPGNAEFLYHRGTTLLALHRTGEALASYDRALAIQPALAEAWNNRGIALREMKRLDEALASHERAVAIRPDYVEAWHNRGIVLRDLRRFDEALACYDKALAIRPDNVGVLHNRGVTLWDMGRFEDSLASFDGALAIRSDNAETWNKRCLALKSLGRAEAALESCDRALAIDPGFADAWNNRGIALRELKRFEEALASYDRAVTLEPDYAEAWNNRGNILQSLGRAEEALASYDRAVALGPDFAEALYNRGTTQWTEYRRYEPAVRDLEAVVRVDPDYDYARGDLLHLRMYGGDWRDYDREVAAVHAGVRSGKRIASPFMYQAVSDSPADLQACATIYADFQHPPAPAVWKNGPRRHDKIRIGYVSGEFRAQATTYLMAGLYERHDKAKFEIVAFDNGWKDESLERRRLEAAFDRMIDIARLTDRAAAEKILGEEIDILVNLNGYFGKPRMGVFAMRPAPIQVNYLGFPGTLGARYMDYIIADRFVVPENERQYYTEHVVWLPDSYQANDSLRAIAPTVPSRAANGLPEKSFVFCSFNQSYKLTPAMFAVWMNILRQVDGSVLWVLESTKNFSENLRQAAEGHGVSGDRLVFAPSIPTDEHLARLRLADLVLDSLPYNAHTTASDALWTGVPIVTCRGTSFPGRVAASLLHAIGLPELVTENLQDYESLAVKLARDPAQLCVIREKLAANRLTTPLFDTDRFRRLIESAYETMWEIFQRGDAAQGFSVDPLD